MLPSRRQDNLVLLSAVVSFVMLFVGVGGWVIVGVLFDCMLKFVKISMIIMYNVVTNPSSTALSLALLQSEL